MADAATTTYTVRYRADGETYRRDVRVASVVGQDIAARLKSILAEAHQAERVELLEVAPALCPPPEEPSPADVGGAEIATQHASHAISLAEIGVDRDRAEHLAAASVVTLADLKAWVREHGSDLTQIRGIGQAGQRHIREQVEAYLAAPPRS